MKCIISPFNNCYKNIGSEEYFFTKFEEDVFYLYVNSPSIVVGMHQNTYSEINQEYVRNHGIDVVRRLSGGGAVYHDLGNLNYGFITGNAGQDINTIFREFTLPIVQALQKFGVTASFSGRNDLVIDNKKISGVAQYHASNKVLLHGTLLFDSDLSKVSASLNADPRKFQDKSVKSVKSRVTNIKPYLTRSVSIEEFTYAIVREIISRYPGSNIYDLTDVDRIEIEKLARLKYSTWEWVYGASPHFTYQHNLKYDKGLLHIGLNIDKGILKEISIHGDFFGEKDLNELKQLLKNIPFERNEVEGALSQIQVKDYIFDLSTDLFIESLFSNIIRDSN